MSIDANKLLLDTNIVSYLLKNSDYAIPYLQHFEGKQLYISFISIGELLFWAESSNWGKKRKYLLEERLSQYITISFDYEIAIVYAQIMMESKRIGRPLSLHDAWIAACAVRHHIPLVTHNAKDFQSISSLTIISEQS